MAHFHDLKVVDLKKTTRDAMLISLQPQDRDTFKFVQGQYLTFAKEFNGTELRRSYSMCNTPDEAVLQIGVKQVEGGCFSTWANTELQVGDTLRAMQPMGHFNTPLNAASEKTYLLFAVGSGITPILSLIRTTLAAEPNARMILVYANRASNTVMFREELEDLKNIYMGRLNVVHILKQNGQDIDLFSGRLDAQKCKDLFKAWIDIKTVDQTFICGPESMMKDVSDVLREHGLRDDQIKYELFASSQPGRISQKAMEKIAAAHTKETKAQIIIDGTTHSVDIPMDGQTVLQAALGADMDAPFACCAGVCSTCRAKVVEGEVEMLANHALEDYEVARGYVLTCQSVPVSDTLVLSYDE